MERDMAPHGILLAPYGRSRPIEFSRSHFYAQHLTRDELNAFLESENLQFDDWFSPRGDDPRGNEYQISGSRLPPAEFYRDQNRDELCNCDGLPQPETKAMMQNLFVTGCGRSGTSMVTGLFAKTGLFMGENLRAQRKSDPKGSLKYPQVNGLNERILLPYLPQPLEKDGVEYSADASRRTILGSRVPPEREIVAGGRDRPIRGAGFAHAVLLKDPRLAYTFRTGWLPVPAIIFICVFPASCVVESILREVRSQPYLHDFAVSIANFFESGNWFISASST